jgi:putative FmdB family regulatory protein
MPIYEYQCESCQTSFEALVTRSEPDVQCPSCGGNHLAREMSVFASSVSNGNSDGAPQVTAAPRACCGGGCGCH